PSWSKEHDWKSCNGVKPVRGFESHSLRHRPFSILDFGYSRMVFRHPPGFQHPTFTLNHTLLRRTLFFGLLIPFLYLGPASAAGRAQGVRAVRGHPAAGVVPRARQPGRRPRGRPFSRLSRSRSYVALDRLLVARPPIHVHLHAGEPLALCSYLPSWRIVLRG